MSKLKRVQTEYPYLYSKSGGCLIETNFTNQLDDRPDEQQHSYDHEPPEPIDYVALKEAIGVHISDMQELMRQSEVAFHAILAEMKEAKSAEIYIDISGDGQLSTLNSGPGRITVASHQALFISYTYARLSEFIRLHMAGPEMQEETNQVTLPSCLATVLVQASSLAAKLCLKAVDTRFPLHKRDFKMFYKDRRNDHEEIVNIFSQTQTKTLKKVTSTPQRIQDKATNKIQLKRRVTLAKMETTPKDCRPKRIPDHKILRKFITANELKKQQGHVEDGMMHDNKMRCMPRFIAFMDVAMQYSSRLEHFLMYRSCHLLLRSDHHLPPSRILMELLFMVYDLINEIFVREMSNATHHLSLLKMCNPNKGGCKKGYSGHGIKPKTVKQLVEYYNEESLVQLLEACQQTYDKRCNILFEKITACSCNLVFHILSDNSEP